MTSAQSEPYVFTSRALEPIERFARGHQLDYDHLCRVAGLPPPDPDPDAVVPATAMSALLEAVAAEVSDDSLGFKLGLAAPIGVAGTLDYVVLNAPILRDALKNLVRFVRVSSTVPAVRFEETPDAGQLIWSTPEIIGPHTQLVDMAIGFTISRVRYAIVDPTVRLDLDLRRLAPVDEAAFIATATARVRFGRPHDRLSLPARALSLSIPRADPNLYRIIAREAERALQETVHASDITQRLMTVIAHRLTDGEPTIAEAASDLGTSSRTLQRELQAAGTSFRQVLETVRRNLAARYLKDTNLSLTEIAFLLGFSELSAFSRAATVWFGEAPRNYRRKATG